MSQSPPDLDLDALAALDSAALGRLYGEASAPASIAALDGEPACRLLAIRRLDAGGRARAARGLAGWRRFPWIGKAFEAIDARHGRGINRIRLGGERRWFPFHTRVDGSLVDGGPCVLLDYDLAQNPAAIRRIRDELREVRAGLFLGPAFWQGRRGPTLALWFACDTRRAAS